MPQVSQSLPRDQERPAAMPVTAVEDSQPTAKSEHGQGRHKDDADTDPLPRRRDIEQVQAVPDDLEHQRAQDRPDHGSPATTEARAAHR